MGKIFTPTASDFGNPDAVVIGGGIVGTATAFWLCRAGLDVVLVEMRDGLSTLTTPASAECFRAQFAEPVSPPSEKVHTDWEFPAIALDKAGRLKPFFEDVEKAVRQPDMNTSAGFYVYTPDDQPLIGPVPEVPGFYVNCGYWAGVMLSPEAGKRISDLVTGKLAPEDNPLRPTRFKEGLGKKGKTLMSH